VSLDKQFTNTYNHSKPSGYVPHVIFFLFLVFVYRVYVIVLGMDVSLATELRNVEWEIFLIYREGLQGVRVGTLEALWREVDRLDGLLADG
jgi:hypothetical protein